MGAFKDAHGGPLRNLYLDDDAAEAAKRGSGGRKSWDLTERQLCDLELLMNGGFSPLEGFLGRADYDSVLADMRLADGALVADADHARRHPGVRRASSSSASPSRCATARACSSRRMTVTDIWQPDKRAEAKAVFGTDDTAHPGRALPARPRRPASISAARCSGIEPPMHYDFKHLRDTPQELRDRFRKLGWRRVVAFQTRNPMHRAHQELTFRAAQRRRGQPADPSGRRHDQARRRRPLHARALLRAAAQALSRADHRAEPAAARDAHGRPARGGLARDHPQELRLHPLHRRPRPRRPGQRQPRASRSTARTPRRSCCASTRTSSASAWCRSRTWSTSRTRRSTCPRTRSSPARPCARHLRHRAAPPPAGRRWRSRTGSRSPRWSRSCARTHPPRHKQGFTVFFTGLSGSGKSTIANALMVKLLELGGRPVTLLDGDLSASTCRASSASRASTATSTSSASATSRREITKNGGIAICAPIAPYAATRAQGARDDRAARRLRRDPRRDARSRSARGATARASTPRRAPASSRSSPASPTRTRRRRIRRCASTRRS